MEINNYSYVETPALLSPNAPIIPNINSPDSPPELNPILDKIPDYKNNIPVVTILDNKTIKLDCLLSKIKPTTIRYKKFLSGLRTTPTFPNTLDLRNNIGPVRDQGTLGSCASFASSAMKEWQERIEGNFNGYLSPAYIYINRRNLPQEGMYLSDVCDILANKGTCTESSYNYSNLTSNPNPNNIKPNNLPSNVIKEANKYRTSNSVLIETINDLKTAFYLHGPCIMGVLIYYPMNKHMWVPTDPNNLDTNWAGGHAMAIVGYNNNGFIIRNSWSERWNPQNTYDMRGHDYLPYEHFKYLTFDYGGEVWSTTDLIQQNPVDPIDPIYIPPTQPKPLTPSIAEPEYKITVFGVILVIIFLYLLIQHPWIFRFFDRINH